MNNADFNDESDSSDEDYIPQGKLEEVLSEVDSDGDPEDPISESEESTSRNRKRKKLNKERPITVRRSEPKESGSKENEEEEIKEEKQQNIDDIWADFMKDTGFKSKTSKGGISESSKNEKKCSGVAHSSLKETLKRPQEKVKVTQIFEFAGEEVKVEKEVSADSAEARLLRKPDDNSLPKSNRGKRNGGLSGISNVLSQLSKKPKISTLEKTKLDWDNFKKEENIEEELQTHNRGKDGYLERQDFLQRADLRRFEIEKNVRSIERSKRFNSTL
nr:craniofacial development protein 1 [Leptinotarsa decemlineata]